MNLLDRTIGFFSPVAGVRRAQARAALEAVRGYEAGQMSRRTAGWKAGGGSANAEIGPGLRRMRNRCREMVRNNEYAAKAIDSLVADTVGTGLTAKAPDQDLWNEWQKQCDADGQLDFAGLMDLVQRTRRESGEALIRFIYVEPGRGMRVPLQLRVMEADHLDDEKTGYLPDGNFVITGVEFEPTGKRAAYWLFPVHPGEAGSLRRGSLRSERVPADEVIHYYRKRRPSQVRGVPELGVALLRLRDIADYEQAELMRKKIESCFAAIVSTDNPMQRMGETQSGGVGSDRERANERMSPGMIKYISNAESVTFGTPSASSGYGDVMSSQLHAVAAGAGTTYEKLTGDMSKVNYSSYRAGQIEYRNGVKGEQWLAFVPIVLNRIENEFQKVARLSGAQRGPLVPFVWTMPKWESHDPLKDALSDKELSRAGVLTFSEWVRSRGDDPAEVIKEGKADRAALKAAGIVSDADAAVSSKALPPEVIAELVTA